MKNGKIIIGICLLVLAGGSVTQAQELKDMTSDMSMSMGGDIDVSDVRPCDSKNPSSWRESQTVEGVFMEDDPSCNPDMPELIAASVLGTNNISLETLNATGLAPDAVIKSEDRDGDGDPDFIQIHIEIIGLNEGEHSLTPFEIAPGISPAFWAFAPKTTGMATEGMGASHLMRMPSPAIRIEQGDEVQITVENTHYLPHTVHLHGVDHPYVDDEGNGNDGVPQTSEMPIMPGESRTYDINPRVAGTMAYHCHVKPDVHVLMGLSGMFIIEENKPHNTVQTFNVGNGKVRHRSVNSLRLYDGEFDLHYQDLDKEMHSFMQTTDNPDEIEHFVNNVYDITERTADYFLLNGQSFPYTLRESQLIVEPDKKYQLRVLNIGSETVALHTHGHKMLVKALDGINLPSGTEYYRDVVDIHAAQRADLILDTTNDGLNSYGSGVWLFHDHEESHITTDGVAPGGGLSMITYREYLGDGGMPITQGMDIRPLFTPEFYDRSGIMDMDDSSDTSMIEMLAVIAAGVVVGFVLMYAYGQRRVAITKRRRDGYASVNHLLIISVVLLGILLTSAYTISYAAELAGIDGIHIMPDGSVMLGTGEAVADAKITSDGQIILNTGESVTPVLDMRPDSTLAETDSTENEEMEMSEEMSHTNMEGMDGIHIMPNGRIMTGTGMWLSDARVTSGDMIELGSGEVVAPMMDMRSGDGVRRTAYSMVVNENFDRLPLGCSEISGTKSITIRAGSEIAEDIPGAMYTYDTRSIEDIEPCTLLTVTFENLDHIRHQFMVHDLPVDTYPMGMFNIEVTGPAEETGTFITPPDKSTLFVHCGVPEHEAKGMIAQIKNGGGDGDIPNIPGVSDVTVKESSLARTQLFILLGLGGLLSGLTAATLFARRRNNA